MFNSIVKKISDNLPEDLDSMTQSIKTVVKAISAQENLTQETLVCCSCAFSTFRDLFRDT